MVNNMPKYIYDTNRAFVPSTAVHHHTVANACFNVHLQFLRFTQKEVSNGDEINSDRSNQPLCNRGVATLRNVMKMADFHFGKYDNPKGINE